MNDVERIEAENMKLALKLMPEKDYWSLPAWGRWYLNWAARWKPKMCKRLKEQGKLVERFDQWGVEITDILTENYNALGMSGGLEIVKEMHLSDPEE